MGMSRWFQSNLYLFFKVVVISILSDLLVEIVPRSSEMWGKKFVVFFIWSWEVLVFVIRPSVISFIFRSIDLSKDRMYIVMGNLMKERKS